MPLVSDKKTKTDMEYKEENVSSANFILSSSTLYIYSMLMDYATVSETLLNFTLVELFAPFSAL
jgi:hypothetical protein